MRQRPRRRAAAGAAVAAPSPKLQAQGRDFWWLNVREKWAFVPAAAVPEALSRVDGWQGDVMGDDGQLAATAWKEVPSDKPWLEPPKKRQRDETKPKSTPKSKPKSKAKGKAQGRKGKKGKGVEATT